MARDTSLPEPASAESHDDPGHRALAGGSARAGVFGFSDGLVTNVSMIIGFAASGVGPGVVRLAGIASAVAGAASMSVGEWVSVRAQNDLVRRETALELRELLHNTGAETTELIGIYRAHGMSKEQATKAANEVMQDPQRALLVHAREEFGIDPTQLPNPISVAMISLVTFLLGAFLPIVPWMIGGGNGARIASIVIGLAAAALAGGIIGRQAHRSVVRSALRQVAVLIIAVTVTYAVGSVVGVNVS